MITCDRYLLVETKLKDFLLLGKNTSFALICPKCSAVTCSTVFLHDFIKRLTHNLVVFLCHRETRVNGCKEYTSNQFFGSLS